jgi:hypothetical protein
VRVKRDVTVLNRLWAKYLTGSGNFPGAPVLLSVLLQAVIRVRAENRRKGGSKQDNPMWNEGFGLLRYIFGTPAKPAADCRFALREAQRLRLSGLEASYHSVMWPKMTWISL